MSYIEGFVAAVPRSNKEAFRKHASDSVSMFKGFGATRHVETWGDVLRLQRGGVEPQAFRSIVAPVVMLHGDADPHPGTATRDLLRRYIPHLEYVGFERCGHEPWRERQARDHFLRVLRQWIART